MAILIAALKAALSADDAGVAKQQVASLLVEVSEAFGFDAEGATEEDEPGDVSAAERGDGGLEGPGGARARASARRTVAQMRPRGTVADEDARCLARIFAEDDGRPESDVTETAGGGFALSHVAKRAEAPGRERRASSGSMIVPLATK